MSAVDDADVSYNLNGRAYGAMSPVSPTAETTENADARADVVTACSGTTNAFFEAAGAGSNDAGLDADEYFVSWRAVQPVASDSIDS
jgi:hypothetical protein